MLQINDERAMIRMLGQNNQISELEDIIKIYWLVLRQ